MSKSLDLVHSPFLLVLVERLEVHRDQNTPGPAGAFEWTMSIVISAASATRIEIRPAHTANGSPSPSWSSE